MTKEEQIKEELNNKYNVYEILGIVILAVVYVVIMYTYTKDGISLPITKDKTVEDITKINLQYDEIMFECPQVILFNDEIKILDELMNKYNINEHNQDKIIFDKEEIQSLFNQLEGSTLTIIDVAVVENISLSIIGEYQQFDLSYKLIYITDENFSKVIYTTNNPEMPFYLNQNNQTYTKAMFPN